MTAPVSTLIAIRPDGSEDRNCAWCGAHYELTVPEVWISKHSDWKGLCLSCIAEKIEENRK
jgi:hypothetical protein